MTGPNLDPSQGPTFNILPPSDERLMYPSEAVPVEQITSPDIQEIIDTMLAISRGERSTNLVKKYMVGLAAPQLGIMKQIVIVDTGFRFGERPAGEEQVSDLNAFINPEIVEASEEAEELFEGCYSVSTDSTTIFGVLPRATRVKVAAYDRTGQPVTVEAEGFTARIFQHEIDHLHGLRFFQRMEPDRPLDVVTGEELQAYGKEGGWHDWPNHTTISGVLGST